MGSADYDEATQKRLLDELKDAGMLFRRPLPSSTDELFILLDKTENVLCQIWQQAPLSALRPLLPIMNALTTDELLRHSDGNIQAAVAACQSEIMRITAPDAPYEDPVMNEIFKLFMVTFKHLSGETDSAYGFASAFGILENFAKVKTCLLMMDVVSEDMIVEMLELFLDSIGPEHHRDVFKYMEMTMTTVIEESEEISFKIVRPLLASVRKDNKDVSPDAWELGKTVIEKCATKLQTPIREAVKAMNLEVDEYAEVVVSMCHDTSSGQNMEKELSVTDQSGAGVSNSERHSKAEEDIGNSHSKDGEGSKSNDENSQETSKSSEQIPQLVINTSRSEVETEIVQSETDGVDVRKKRGRRPSSLLMRPEEGYEHPCASDPSLKNSDSSKEGKNGRTKKKESTKNQHNDMQWSSEVGRRILEGKMESGSDAKKKGGKSNKEKEERILGDNAEEKDLSLQRQTGKNEINLHKRESKEMVGSASTSKTPKTKPRKNLSQEKKPRKPAVKYGEELVNLRIQVWWPKDKMFYAGTVAAFDPVSKRHRIRYDDEEIEILNLSKERWEPLNEMKPEETQSAGRGDDRPSSPNDPTQEKTAKRKKPSVKAQNIASSSKRRKHESHADMKSGDNSLNDVINAINDPDNEESHKDEGENLGGDKDSHLMNH